MTTGQVIACTGHRPDKFRGEWDMDGKISDWLLEQTKSYLISAEPKQVVTGMALGYDMIFALAAIELELPILAAVPFIGQEDAWPQRHQALYNEILSLPLVTLKVVSEGEYSAQKMQIRNEFMVDNCDVLLAAWDGSTGGTYNCLKYAKRVNRPIHYLDVKGFMASL